ncbi:MAG: lipoprotein [Nitrospirae bacterium]|nr:MAG: lipoprotein [Nitrospirota bacterium]
MKKILALMLILLVFVAACGKSEIKKPTADSLLATEAFVLAEKVRGAYVARDMSALQANTTPEGYKAITESMKLFDSATLEFNPLLFDIREGKMTLFVSWTGVWKKRGQTFDERGLVVFGLKGRPLKVDTVQRASPFRYPED